VVELLDEDELLLGLVDEVLEDELVEDD